MPVSTVGVDHHPAVTSADALDRESEEVEPLVDRHDAGLLLGELETERRDHLLDLLDQCLGVLPAARDADDEVVRVTREPVCSAAVASDLLSCWPCRHRRLPRPGEVLVQHRQRGVGDQRRENPALRGAGERLFSAAQLRHDPGLEERLDERHDALVRDPPPHPDQSGRVRKRVEARLDISLENPLIGVGREHVYLGDRVMGSASRPEPVGAGLEIRLEDRLKHRLEGSLNYPVAEGGHPEATELSAALGYQPFLDRQWPEGPGAQLLTEPVKELLYAQHLFDMAGGLPVHARRARPSVRPDPEPRHHQHARVANEVVQVIEPAVGIVRCPLVQLCAESRVPSPPPPSAQATERRHSPATSSHSRRALQARCSPSSCGRLSRPPRWVVTPTTTTRAPPRPGALGGRCAVPARQSGRRRHRDGSHVHYRSLVRVGAQLFPCGTAVTRGHASRTRRHAFMTRAESELPITAGPPLTA